uniref:asparagine synthase (glutamine-hydrolyzing) n=1 Tax=Magnetococcus massalia (strain MO-1) TaxID=451514 RepID=A0A1S7LK39_MAGMO|nr:Putative asparagine synthase, glutamine-hydrolyzing [Candidatus Magnetococcus massalia]
MCGIAGVISLHTNLSPAQQVERMLRAIHHRGPDDGGLWQAEGIAVGMRRLSIIDLAGAKQPMVSADAQHVLVFNGEIYNYRELRQQLSQAGHHFTTQGDGEVILHGYRHWGEQVTERLEGMFAFAIVDRQQQKLLLARDHFGIKPLYLAQGEDPQGGAWFAFCSEPDPLMALPGLDRTIHQKALARFLSLKYVPAPDTLIRGITKLPLATQRCVQWGDGPIEQQSRKYWQLEAREPGLTGAQAQERLQHLLKQAVSRQMVSDVPVGLFLSGGIDSGLLAWATQAENAPLHGCYTIGFERRDYDESPLAKATASHLKLPHTIDRLAMPGPEALEGWLNRYGEPFANLSIPANFMVSEAAAQHVKVVLNGAGADELFGGYDRYFAVQPPWPLRLAGIMAPLLKPLLQHLPSGHNKRSLVQRGRIFLDGVGGDLATRHANSVRLFAPHELATLAPQLPQESPGYLAHHFAQAPPGDALQQASWTDVESMQADDYLTLMDRTSMASSLEVRVPFLDLELAQFAFSLPAAQKMDGWQKKRLLRQLAAEVLPGEVARGAKHGFETPVGDWLKGEWGAVLQRLVSQGALASLVEQRRATELIHAHRTGQWQGAKPLFALLTLGLWMEKNQLSL